MKPLISTSALRAMATVHRLLDARETAEYEDSHLVGALGADPDRDLSTASEPGSDPRHGGRHPLPPADRWARRLGEWGIAPGTPVVIYDARPGLSAARLWWMLRASGHEDVAVLDGGWEAALADGFEVESGARSIEPLPPYPFTGWTLPLVDIDEVDRLARDPSWKVVDVRAPQRYRGETEPLDPVAGHIPGAWNKFFAEHLGPDGRFLDPATLRRMYAEFLGGTPPERVVTYCGSGFTSAHTLLALEVAGLPGGAMYVGSWSEWCRSGRPIATGERA